MRVRHTTDPSEDLVSRRFESFNQLGPVISGKAGGQSTNDTLCPLPGVLLAATDGVQCEMSWEVPLVKTRLSVFNWELAFSFKSF